MPENGKPGLPWGPKDSAAPPESAPVGGAPKKAGGRYVDMQSAMRFPIKLPVSVKSKAGERHAETQNISANGVLFQVVDAEMPVGSMVDFTISLPPTLWGRRLTCSSTAAAAWCAVLKKVVAGAWAW